MGLRDLASALNRRLGLVAAVAVLVTLAVPSLTAERMGYSPAEFAARHYGSVLDLALAMAGYTQGALLAGFALAFQRRAPRRDLASGFVWAAPLSMTAVLSVAWPQTWAFWVVVGSGGLAALLWCATRLRREGARALGGLAVLIGVTALLAWNQARGTTLAWPWFVPVGAVYTYVLSRVLARRTTG